ncbi:MAG: type II toxin-antitoxin system RelE/ParE family toxin [Burkholderiaceae bacterium]
MYEVIQSQLARNDLKGIFRYSFEKWGADKAAEYLLQIDAGIHSLTDNPNIGRSRAEIRDGYRSIQINRHIVFYRIQGQSINVVRVLHGKRHPSTTLYSLME